MVGLTSFINAILTQLEGPFQLKRDPPKNIRRPLVNKHNQPPQNNLRKSARLFWGNSWPIRGLLPQVKKYLKHSGDLYLFRFCFRLVEGAPYPRLRGGGGKVCCARGVLLSSHPVFLFETLRRHGWFSPGLYLAVSLLGARAVSLTSSCCKASIRRLRAAGLSVA